jgi:hypothetical protein
VDIRKRGQSGGVHSVAGAEKGRVRKAGDDEGGTLLKAARWGEAEGVGREAPCGSREDRGVAAPGGRWAASNDLAAVRTTAAAWPRHTRAVCPSTK